MKGVVFNLLEEVVVRARSEDAWDALLETTGLSGAYTSLGSYPDEHLAQLVQAAATALDMAPNEVVRWFGRSAMPVLAERYPAFFTAQPSTRPFVLSVNNIIHPEVRKLYPGANCPNFDFEDAPDGALLMGYHSQRRMCALAHGFIEGAADHYHENVLCEHLQCMLRGDAKCLLRISFS